MPPTPAPDPQFFFQVVLSLGLLLNFGLGIVALFRSGAVQKRQVSFGEEYAGKTDFSKLQSEFGTCQEREREDRHGLRDQIEASRLEVKEDMRQLRTELKGDLDGVHSRITEVFGAMKELKGEVK